MGKPMNNYPSEQWTSRSGYVREWNLEQFNGLPLIQRITIINQTNKIINAFRNHLQRRNVSNKYKYLN